MATGAVEVEQVKGAISSGSASLSTVAALRALLGLELSQLVSAAHGQAPIRNKAQILKSTPAANSTPVNSRSKKTQPVTVLEDKVRTLSGREKYALATETVNNSLKLLADSLKVPTKTHIKSPPATKDVISTPAPQARSPGSKKALQPRSGNSTPARSSSSKCGTARVESFANGAAQCSNYEILAECAHVAFAFLRAVDPQKLGVRETPKLQLETGVLALVGKMVAHGLERMAVKELRLVKQSLESMFCPWKATKINRSSSKLKDEAPETETLASLLRLDICCDSNPEVLPVAISYQLHVLKIISIARKSAIIESAVENLSIDTPNSPVDLILKQAGQASDNAKSVKQLDALSQTILALCPSIASTVDEVAQDPKLSPTPAAVFKLQVLALKIRKVWWSLARHQAEVSKELMDPFSKCATAFLRRQQSTKNGENTYELLADSFRALGPFDSDPFGSTLFDLLNLLSSQAELAGLRKDALEWTEEMVQRSSSLETNHSRRVACIVRKTVLVVQQDGNEDHSNTAALTTPLQSSLTGNSYDYDLLIAALSSLAKVLITTLRRIKDPSGPLHVMSLAAGFALRYSRSSPGKNMHHLQIIMDVTMRLSKSGEDLLAWVTEYAPNLFIGAGALQAVAGVASTRPLSEAWVISNAAISLSRIIRALMLKAVRGATDDKVALVFDNEQFNLAERGALLEWQLRYAFELAPKARYQSILRKLLPDLLRRLSEVYTATEHPIRRARVAILAFRLRVCHPDLLPPHNFKVWRDDFVLDRTELYGDERLQQYFDDVKAGLAVVHAFYDGRPTIEELMPNLSVWVRIIGSSRTARDLCDYIDDTQDLRHLFGSLVAYFDMLGEDEGSLPTQRLLTTLTQLAVESVAPRCTALIALAQQYLHLGYSEKAGSVLVQAHTSLAKQDPSNLAHLQYQLAYAEYLLAIDNVDKCRSSLDEAKSIRSAIPPEQVSRADRRSYELLHARTWLVQSKYMLEIGSPHEALAAAKRSVRVFNSIWSSLERSTGIHAAETVLDATDKEDSNVSSVTKGIKKLHLTPVEANQCTDDSKANTKGASFWPIAPVLCKALLHLSDMYAHHGLFNEANYYSERAISIAESVGSPSLMSRIRSHRCQLLALAGCVEDAELCFAQEKVSNSNAASLAVVERYCARAAIRAKEGSFEQAKTLNEKAVHLVEQMSSDEFLARLENFNKDDDELQKQTATLSIADSAATAESSNSATLRAAAKGRAKAPKKTDSKAAAGASKKKATSLLRSNGKAERPVNPPYCLSKLREKILLKQALMSVRLGEDIGNALTDIDPLQSSTIASLHQREAQYSNFMQKAKMGLETDVTLNILAESTLSFPAALHPERLLVHETPETSVQTAVKAQGAKARSTAKSTRKGNPEVKIEDLLHAARECLLKGNNTSVRFRSTARTHIECAMLSSATLLLSAIAESKSIRTLHPVKESLAVDLPRIKALQFEEKAIAIDTSQAETSEPLMWPSLANGPCCDITNSAEFQEKFIDIIPKSWTAVSLCLSGDANELYIARYNARQMPLIVKLPFTRHKPEGLDEDPFDYHKGKAELQEIIQLSNYTCHSTGSLEGKGAKTNWWSEREALDRRLHELVINIENIWFGGFKGVFAKHVRDLDLLPRFRKSFEDILDRHLPSRNKSKGQAKRLRLDDKILELFIGLGHDQDGTADLDEPLSDLLYFVVDMLLFSGERNAYDEIDFDGMAVDVLDALRSFHDASVGAEEENQHLILVLDRRLHAFPWESMPCLEGVGVSRVGSMLSLRECIMAMRSLTTQPSDDSDVRHVVQRGSGTYILNPSSDLTGTQASLGPTLSGLAKAEAARWTEVVNEAPSEDCFSTALSQSSMLLYFGHGAGSQYVRPRSIKRLDRCSEVVWLMGCSSGAVSEYGDLESSAVPLAYLLAGRSQGDRSDTKIPGQNGSGKCMAVVATLWDVTDKDIDRFSLAMGEEWGLWPGAEHHRLPAKTPAKTPRKREVVAAPSTPQQAPKTPKTPKVVKTPAPFKTPARSRSRPLKEDSEKRSLMDAVARSREVCYLRYLNGAAPVVYGVPVYLGD